MAEMETYHSGRKRWTAVAAASVIFAVWAWWRPFRAAVQGDSMAPALSPGDIVVATARGRVRRGTLVVVERPGHSGVELVKRVTAVPGDIAPDLRVLGEGEYWVEGDHATRSTDSRTFGPVRGDAIRGVVRFRSRERSRYSSAGS